MKKVAMGWVLLFAAGYCSAGTITAYGDKSESSQTTTTSANGQTTTTQWKINCSGNMNVVCAVISTGGPTPPKSGDQVHLSVFDNGNWSISQTGTLVRYTGNTQNMNISISNDVK